jgi:hypothetical protein
MKILYEPYVMSFFIALIFSLAYYLFKNNIKNNNQKEEEDENLLTNSVIVLLLSYIIIMIMYYSYKYISFENSIPFMTGGSAITALTNSSKKHKENEDSHELERRREKMMERLTVVDDDIDVDILED